MSDIETAEDGVIMVNGERTRRKKGTRATELALARVRRKEEQLRVAKTQVFLIEHHKAMTKLQAAYEALCELAERSAEDVSSEEDAMRGGQLQALDEAIEAIGLWYGPAGRKQGAEDEA